MIRTSRSGVIELNPVIGRPEPLMPGAVKERVIDAACVLAALASAATLAGVVAFAGQMSSMNTLSVAPLRAQSSPMSATALDRPIAMGRQAG